MKINKEKTGKVRNPTHLRYPTKNNTDIISA